MPKRSDRESLKNIDEQLKKLNLQKKELDRSIEFGETKKARKERARRLIETGALAEKYFEMQNLSISEKEEVFKMFSAFINKNKPDKFKK